MLDFSFSTEQETMRRLFRDFAESVLPRYREWDAKEEFPWEQWNRMAEIGLTGMTISEQYGGAGMGYVEAGIAAEEVGRGILTVPTL
ncbi:acyl-CoA dehydrogenase family protein [Kyrpidia spormannii]|uniref:Cyclohexanecarboxyl-CoA dehydrogenase n=1 Tax=Kyrpidia spormannii TaxID=2055160 RepID=A0A6F9EDB4_9BACL